MKKLFLLPITVLIFFFSSSNALACSCPTVGPYGPVERNLKYGSAVFTGEVINIDSSANRTKITFEVTEFWKGNLTSQFTVSTDRSSCRYDFELGKKYLVFANLWNNEQFTGACSANRELEQAEEALKILGKGKRPKPTGVRSRS